MNRREKVLTILVVAAIAVAAAFQFAPEGAFEVSALGGGDLDRARRSFRESYRMLQLGPQIRLDYERFEAQFPEQVGNRTPESTFTVELDRLLTDKGWTNPQLKPPKRVKIKDIDDYYYIDIDLTLPAVRNQQDAIDLLADLQTSGLLIKHFKIAKPRPDIEVFRLDAIVSRLAKLSPEEREQIAKSRSRGR